MIALKEKRDLSAGMWLSGLLLKPQMLILVIPGLLFRRKWRLLIGFLTLAIGIFLLSIALSGTGFITGLYETIVEWPTSLGNSGMNIRSFVVNMTRYLNPQFANTIGLIFGLVIIVAVIKMWVKAQQENLPIESENLLLVTFLATFSISPHSNVHMALAILALGMVSYVKKQIPQWLALLWIGFPAILFLIVSFKSVGIAHAVGGMSMLLVNLILLLYLLSKSQKASIVQ